MKQYRCHKVVKAEKIAQTRWFDGGFKYEFILEGGDVVPAPHDCPNNRVAPVGAYYVVYEDGYTSWSPAATFEAGYAEVKLDTSTALDRAKAELLQLYDRKNSLVLFIQGAEFSKLPKLTQSQLLNQSRFMEGYAAVLAERIEGWQ